MTPVGIWRYRPDLVALDVSGRDFAATRKFRNVFANPRAALVIDTSPPARVAPPGGADRRPGRPVDDDAERGGPLIRITPDRAVSWGL